ncbi:hypothetical protein PG993_002268 [Apiospora rasikravindrae]|uniref:Ankyrin repeat protein n=1 Tax=Apiospora rasikravindrae TaxID=990691 RepID=A0ABR1TYU5_9PEZI
MELALYALVIAGIDPKITTHMSPADMSPISWAAQNQWLEGIGVLLECGADPNVCDWAWGGPPLYRTDVYETHVSETGHYLLLNGADPLRREWYGLDSWGKVSTNACLQYRGMESNDFQYIWFEGSIAHLLLHGADPFEVFATVPPRNNERKTRPGWFDTLAQVRASDVAKIWCTQYHAANRRWAMSNHEFESSEARIPSWKFEWDDMGQITRRFDSDNEDTYSQTSSSTQSSRVDTSSWRSGDDTREEWLFFRNATRFHHHTSTERGLEQLSRFPMVRALCDGLQYAGYRAEMDSDGDIWYDCDDGDRYFEAWEVQPAEERREWLRDVCPICQDFEGYGLGRALERGRQGKEQLYEYRSQVAKGKNSVF